MKSIVHDSNIHQVLTWYSNNNNNNSNSVINLCFLCSNSIELNNHIIISELWYSFDYTPFIINIFIVEEFIQDKYHTIIKKQQRKKYFIVEFVNSIENINTTNISNKDNLECIVQEYSKISKKIWYKHSKYISITKHFKD